MAQRNMITAVAAAASVPSSSTCTRHNSSRRAGRQTQQAQYNDRQAGEARPAGSARFPGSTWQAARPPTFAYTLCSTSETGSTWQAARPPTFAYTLCSTSETKRSPMGCPPWVPVAICSRAQAASVWYSGGRPHSCLPAKHKPGKLAGGRAGRQAEVPDGPEQVNSPGGGLCPAGASWACPPTWVMSPPSKGLRMPSACSAWLRLVENSTSNLQAWRGRRGGGCIVSGRGCMAALSPPGVITVPPRQPHWLQRMCASFRGVPAPDEAAGEQCALHQRRNLVPQATHFT
jgi:hypothetical protein